MTGKFCLLPLFLFIAVFLLTVLNVEGAEEMECKSAMGLLMRRLAEGITSCSKSLTFKNMKDRSHKFHCIIKCVAMENKVLNPEGLLDKETIESFMKKEIPENLRGKAAPIIWGCHDANVGKLDPAEEFCKSYKPFIKCFMDSLPTFCGPPAEGKN